MSTGNVAFDTIARLTDELRATTAERDKLRHALEIMADGGILAISKSLRSEHAELRAALAHIAGLQSACDDAEVVEGSMSFKAIALNCAATARAILAKTAEAP